MGSKGPAPAARTSTQDILTDISRQRQATEKADVQKQIDEVATRVDKEESDGFAEQIRDEAKKRQQLILANNNNRGRRSTLLTGSLGLTDPAVTAGKTLLGL